MNKTRKQIKNKLTKLVIQKFFKSLPKNLTGDKIDPFILKSGQFLLMMGLMMQHKPRRQKIALFLKQNKEYIADVSKLLSIIGCASYDMYDAFTGILDKKMKTDVELLTDEEKQQIKAITTDLVSEFKKVWS